MEEERVSSAEQNDTAALFGKEDIMRMPTSAPVISCTDAIARRDTWGENGAGEWVHEYHSQKGGDIVHFLTADSRAGRPEALAYDAAIQIVDCFAWLTVQLHLLFAIYCMETTKPWEDSIEIPVDRILRDLGMDKRTDWTRSKKICEVVTHAELLNSLAVKIVAWQQGEKDLSVRACRMWDIAVDFDASISSCTGTASPRNVTITVRAGLWAEEFLNRESLLQYGFLPRHVLQLDYYHKPITAHVALYLLAQARIKIPRGQPMRFRVGTLLLKAVSEQELAEARVDRKKRSRLANQWDKVLVSLSGYGWSVAFDDATYPADLRCPYFQGEQQDRCTPKRPRDYWDRLMKATVEIYPPEGIVRSLEELRRRTRTSSIHGQKH